MHSSLTVWFGENAADVSSDLVVIFRVLHENLLRSPERVDCQRPIFPAGQETLAP
jgi:hypothetical protein